MPCALPLTGSSGTPITGQNMRDSVVSGSLSGLQREHEEAVRADVRREVLERLHVGCSDSSVSGERRPISSREFPCS
jgi:hypothetical protein